MTIFHDCPSHSTEIMKRPVLTLLVSLGALTSCETMHNAAVSTFRVVDAPNQYIRRNLGMNEQDQPQTTTTTTTTTEGTYPVQGNPPPQTSTVQTTQPYNQPPNQAPPSPPVQTQRTIASVEERESSQPPPRQLAQPTATPRFATRETTSRNVESQPTATPRVSSAPRTTSTKATATTGEFPYAKPVPGKPGYVFSPFDQNGGYVDVTGYSPGQKVKDPYTGKIFLVP
jgi:hypothetical protein